MTVMITYPSGKPNIVDHVNMSVVNSAGDQNNENRTMHRAHQCTETVCIASIPQTPLDMSADFARAVLGFQNKGFEIH